MEVIRLISTNFICVNQSNLFHLRPIKKYFILK